MEVFMDKPTGRKVYDLVHAKASPLIKHYRNDLEVIDREVIEKFPGVPFIHYTREMGTHIICMPDANDENWPKHGEKIRYLFGNASRYHILDEKLSIAKYMSKNEAVLLTLHFDGYKVRVISNADAESLILGYQTNVRSIWHQELNAKLYA